MDEIAGSARVLRALEELGLDHIVVRTTPANSAEESALLQEIELPQLLKTIVVRKAEDDHVFVLVPGDREIDWKKLRRSLGVSRASLPAREDAEELTGYKVGAITPFGSSTPLPVVIDALALAQPLVALGGGERGTNVHVDPGELQSAVGAQVADVTSPQRPR